MMKEAARGGVDMKLLADPLDGQAVERFERTFRLAMGRAEGGEIMVTDEVARALPHCVEVERVADSPGAGRVERERDRAVRDPIQVAAAGAGEPRVPVVGDGLRGKYDHRVGAQQRVQSLAEAMRGEAFGEVEMRGHAKRMDPGIGSPGRMGNGRFAGDRIGSALDRSLDGGTLVLSLPAKKRAAVPFENQLPAGHGRWVPGGIANPRSRSAGGIGAFPAR